MRTCNTRGVRHARLQRFFITTFALAAVASSGSLLAAGQASASAVSPPRGSIVEPTGGMVITSGNAATRHTARGVTTAKVPSCRSITYKGNAGAIHVQTSKNGYVAWGIYMYNPKLDAGPWTVDVYVGSRRVDHKKQNYAPHGSVNPKDAKKGKTFHISATHHANANGKNYKNVPNECIIP